MKTTPLLLKSDASTLRSMLDHEDFLPKLQPDQRESLMRLLDTAHTTSDESIMENRVGLHDVVTLVCCDDPADWYQMEIVLPHEADIDSDRITVVHPMCLAMLGHSLEDEISWDTHHGIRTMKINGIRKEARIAA